MDLQSSAYIHPSDEATESDNGLIKGGSRGPDVATPGYKYKGKVLVRPQTAMWYLFLRDDKKTLQTGHDEEWEPARWVSEGCALVSAYLRTEIFILKLLIPTAIVHFLRP